MASLAPIGTRHKPLRQCETETTCPTSTAESRRDDDVPSIALSRAAYWELLAAVWRALLREPSADLLRKLDDDPVRAADVAQPMVTLVHDRLDDLERRVPGMTDATRRGWSGTIIRLERAVRTGSYEEFDVAAGACEGNGLLIDISDPADPRRVDAVADPLWA
jgi:hypothetical protein